MIKMQLKVSVQTVKCTSSRSAVISFPGASFCTPSPAGSNYHTERAARSDRVHLLRQDWNSDTERHAVQKVYHRGTQLRYRSAIFHSDIKKPKLLLDILVGLLS